MANVIKRVADAHGLYRVIKDTDVSYYPSADWLHDPDLINVVSIPMRYWKVDADSVVEMSQAEKDLVDSNISDKENVSLAGTWYFEKNGTVKNKWLGFGAGKTSNTVPFIVPFPMVVTAITYSNSKNSTETDIEIYKDGSKVYTWEVRDKRHAWKTSGMHNLSFMPGDTFGIYLKDQGTDPKHVIVAVHYRVWSHQVGEGGSSTL